MQVASDSGTLGLDQVFELISEVENLPVYLEKELQVWNFDFTKKCLGISELCRVADYVSILYAGFCSYCKLEVWCTAFVENLMMTEQKLLVIDVTSGIMLIVLSYFALQSHMFVLHVNLKRWSCLHHRKWIMRGKFVVAWSWPLG